MKKEYINPEMEVVMLQTKATILAGSGEGGVEDGDSVGNQVKDSDAGLFSSQFFDNGGSEDW